MTSGKFNQARMQTHFREARSATRAAKKQLKEAQKAYDDAKSREQRKRLEMFGVDTSSIEENRRDL